LEQSIGIIKKILELVAMRTECFRGELRGHFDSGHGRIFRDVADFIDLNARFPGERGFELFSKRRRFGVATGKSTDETRELRLSQIGRKVDAGDAGSDKKLRKAAFACGCTEGHAVEENLVS
jgi:hypothetical protein